MEQYDLMYNVVDNPDSTVLDFRDAGFNAENTTLKDISVYLEDPYIKELFTENGIFLESKVREAYDNASIMYNIMATDSYDEYVKLSIPWGKYNTDVDPSLRSQGPRYTMIAESNPMHIAWSMLEIGLAGLPAFSPSENAQTENILTNPSEVFANGEDNPDWSVAIWDDSPNETFFSNFFTPLVLAQYDSDGTHIDPITGQRVEHTKGSLKLNQKGNYYYEYLDGRDIYGRLLLNKTDIITVDGSWLNQYDFFDCDDIKQKSFVGTVMRNLALVGTMYIPGVGPWITLLGMIPLLATMTATLGKMIVGSDSPNLSALEGWGKSLDKFSSSTLYAQEHPWCLENLVNLMGMVAGQLQELRIFFEYIPAIFNGGKNMYNEETSKAVLAKFAEEEGAIFSKRATDLSKLASKGGVSMQEMLLLSHIKNILNDNSVFKTYIETAAQARMTAYMKDYNKIGSILSKGYMTMLTVQDTYGEAKLAGASDLEAVALTLGYAAGEAWILNTGIGEWILPELRYEREFNKQVIRTLFKDNMETVKKLEDQFLKKGMSSSAPLKRSFFKEVFKIGNSLAEESSVVARAGRALLANGIGEGIEETTEELLADFSKACFNVVNDWRGDDTRIDAFEYNYETGEFNGSGLFDRYALSFVGGLGGGAIFSGVRRNYRLMKLISSMTHQQAIQELVYRIRNGKYNELIKDINRYQLGNKHLSAYRYEEVGDSYVLALGTPTDNLDLAVKKIAIDLINMVKDLLDATGGNISDQSFLAGLADMIKGLRHAAIINTSVAGQLLRTYNTTLSELFQYTTDVNAEKLKLKDRNGNGTIEDSEETKAKQLTEAEALSIKLKIAELEAKRKEKELYLKDLIEGKKKKEFILDALFEISTGIFGREALSTFTFYAENKEGKKISEISKDRLELLKKEYATFKLTNSAERTHTLSLLYAEIAEKTSDLLNSAAGEYNLRDLEVRRLILLFSNLNNAILLGVSEADNYLGYLQDSLYKLAEILGTLKSLDLNNIIKEIREEASTTLLEKVNEKGELLKLLKADPENESLQDNVKKIEEEINNMLNNMNLKIDIAVLSKTPEIIQSILTKYEGNLNQSILSSLYNFVNFRLSYGYYFLKQYLENHIGGAGVVIDPRSAELLNNILNEWKIGNTIYKPFSILGNRVLYEPEAFMEMLGISDPLAEEVGAFAEKYATLLQSIEDAGKNSTKLEQLINEFALSIGSPTTVTFSLLLNNFDEELRKSSLLYNDLSSNSELRSLAEEMLNLLKIFRMAIAGAKQNAVDLNTLYGYNATLNELSGTKWAVIDDATANQFLAETDLMISKLDSIIRVYEQLEGLKLKNNDKIEVIKDTILYLKVKLIILVDDFKSWAGYSDFVAVVNSLKLHNELASKFRLLNSEERLLFLKETIQLENAVYDLFNNPDNEANLSPEKLSKLLDHTKLGDSLFINRASILGIDTKDIDANTFISWLASRAAVRSSDLRKKLLEVYEDDKKNNIVPVTALEEAAFIAFSIVNNLKMLSTFIDAYKVALKETWSSLDVDDRLKLMAKITLNSEVLTIKKYRELAETPDYLFYLMDLPRYKYAAIIEGMPGTGKTRAVFSLVYKLIQKTTPDALKKVYYIHGASEASAKAGLAALGLSTGHKAMDRSAFMKEIDPKWTDKTNLEQVKASELNATVNSEKEIISNNTISTTPDSPTIIFIDEISKFTLVDMSEIEEYCKLNNCIVIGAGDFNQIGCSVNITNLDEPKLKDSTAASSLARTHFIGSPKLGLVLRTDNATKTANLMSLQQYIDAPLAEREKIELSYSEESDGLFGDKVIKTLSASNSDLSDEAKLELIKAVKLMVDTLKDGQKIIYLYDKASSKDPEIYSEILAPYKDKIALMDIRAALGTEGLYYITDLVDATSGALINMLYTGISRATQGSISIVRNEKDFSKILNTKIDSSIRMQDLSDTVRARFTQARLKLLKSALEEFDETTTWEIKRNTTSSPVAPAPTTVTKYANGADGKFSKDELVEAKGDSVYELTLDEKAKTGEFTIVNKDDFLIDPSTYSDCVETKGTGSIIASITPGKLELDSDGNWKITSKAVVTLVEKGFNLGNLDILDSSETLYTSDLSDKDAYISRSGESAFTLNNKVDNTRTFSIDLPSAFMTVFNASSDLLKGIIEYTGTPTDTSTVTVEEMGKMTKQADGSWVITKPIKIKFEEAPATPSPAGSTVAPSAGTTPVGTTPPAGSPSTPPSSPPAGTIPPSTPPAGPTPPSVSSSSAGPAVPLPAAPKKKEEILSSFTEELDESENIPIPEDITSDQPELDLLESPAKEEVEKLEETNKNTELDYSTIRTYSFNTFEIGGELKITGLNTYTFTPNRFKNNPRIIGFDGLITLLTAAGYTFNSEVINEGTDNEVTIYKLTLELVDFLKKTIAEIQDLARSTKPTMGSTKNDALEAIVEYIKGMIEEFPIGRGTRKPSLIIKDNIKVTFILNQSPENYTPQNDSTPKMGDRFVNDTVEYTYGTFNRAPRTTINVRISIEKATESGTNFIDVFDTPIVNLGNFASILNYLEYQNGEKHKELISTWKSLKASIGNNIVELAQKIVEYLEGKDYKTIKLLAKLFLHLGRSAIILNDNWYFSSTFTNLGVNFTTFKGHTAVNPNMSYTAEGSIDLLNLHRDPRVVVTKVYKSIDGSMTGVDSAGNERTIFGVCKAGHPFVFVTDDLSLLGENDEIVKRYFLQLTDSSLEKRVKLVYVLTPEYDILQYIRNIDYILNGDTENRSFIGNLFTSYKMFLKLLEKDDSDNFIHLDVVDILKIALDGSKTTHSKFDNLVSIIEDLNSADSQDTIKNRLLTKGSYFGFASEATLSGSFDYLLYKLMTPDSPFESVNVLEFIDLVLNNPDAIDLPNALVALDAITKIKKALASDTKLKPITSVYYWARALKGASTINGLVEVSKRGEINGKPLRVMGKFETSVYQGDITDLLELLDNEINIILTKDEKNRPKYYGSHTLKCADGKVRWATKKEESKYTVKTLKNSRGLTIKDVGSISFPNKLVEGMSDELLLKIYEFFTKLGFTDPNAIDLFNDKDFREVIVSLYKWNDPRFPFGMGKVALSLLNKSKVIFNNKIIKLNESQCKLISDVRSIFKLLNSSSMWVSVLNNTKVAEISYNDATNLVIVRETSINPEFIPSIYNKPMEEIGDFLLSDNILYYKDFSIPPFSIPNSIPITSDLCNTLIEQYNALSSLLKSYCKGWILPIKITPEINVLASIEQELRNEIINTTLGTKILKYDSTYSSLLDFFEKNPKFVIEEDGLYFEIDLIKGTRNSTDAPVITESTHPELNKLLKIQDTLNAKSIINNRFTSLLNEFTVNGSISEDIIEELTSNVRIYTKLIDRLIPHVDPDLVLYLNDLKLFIQDNLEKNDSCKPGF